MNVLEAEAAAPEGSALPPPPLPGNRSSVVARKPASVQVKRRPAPDNTYFNLDMAVAEQQAPASIKKESLFPSETFFVESTSERPRSSKSKPESPSSSRQQIVMVSSTEDPANSDEAVPILTEVTTSHLEELIAQYGSNPAASVGGALLDTPPPFGASDLATLIDQVLKQVAIEMGVAVKDVVGAHVPGSSTRNNAPTIAATLTPAQMSLKIKTMSYSNAEMGKKLEIANKAISDLISNVAKLEGEKAAALFLVDRMKRETKALELRARTAEAAVNAYDEEFRKSVEALMAAAATTGNFQSESIPVVAPRIISVKLNNNNNSKNSKSRKLSFTDFSSDEEASEAEAEGYASDDPTKITKKVINDTAKMLAAKKKFDPPSILSVGLKSCLEKEEQIWYPTPHAQTQHLLSATTPSEYLRILHSQLEGMTHSIHECLDALAEERRIREKWRAKWEKTSWLLKKEVSRRKKEVEEREGARYRGSYLVNALEPINGYHRGAVDVLDDVLGTSMANGNNGNGVSGGDAKRTIHTAPHGVTRRVGFEHSLGGSSGTSPPQQTQQPHYGNPTEDVDASDRWESRSRSVASGYTNRPRYQSDMGSAGAARMLFKQRGQTAPQGPARVPTVKNEIENGEYGNSHTITDPRLVDIVTIPGYASSVASSSFTHGTDRTGTTGRKKKINYAIPPVSAVVPFENPLIKKKLRKKSPASALKHHWDTSATI
ncbi:UNVERIFIED_CONTAM: hypothetical protein HDU68_007570 [Siphonaria sp. JEL0065]|nr:hypothetical protein HDU68_007570 [Siphonaria sp. JEL0065]